jgi:hypothetical protein
VEPRLGRSKRAWITAGVAATVVIALSCCTCTAAILPLAHYASILGLFLRPGWHAATVVPADTAILLTINIDAGNLAGLGRLLRIYRDSAGDEQFFDEVVDPLETLESEMGITFEDDIRPWLGTEIALAALDAESPAGGDRASVAFLAATTDRAASNAFLAKMRNYFEDEGHDVDAEPRKDVTYQVNRDGSEPAMSWAYGTVGDYVILTLDRDALQMIIDVHEGKVDPLAASDRFSGVARALPRNAAAFLYDDLAQFADAAAENAGAGTDPCPALDFDAGAEALGVALELERDGIRVEAVVTFEPGELSPLATGVLSVEPASRRILQHIPTDAMAFASTHVTGGTWRGIEAALATCPGVQANLNEVSDSVGLNLDVNLLSWIAGEWAVALVRVERKSDYELPFAAFTLAEIGDEDAARNALDRLAAFVEVPPAIAFEEESIGGVEVQILREPRSKAIVVGYGIIDRYAFVGMLESGPEAAVTGNAAPITQNGTFDHVRAHLPDNATSLAYVGVEEIVTLFDEQAAGHRRSTYETEVRPYLAPVKAIGVATTRPDMRRGRVTFTLYAYVP